MRIDEAFRRMIGGYWWLIGLLVLVASLAAGVYATNQDLQYQASARVQMSGGLASTNVQADAATQWLQGVITTPNTVRHAMAAAGLEGDPTPFATHSIVVNRVGVSTVNDVLVTTGNADRSVIVANSLVQQALKYANTAHQSDAVKMTALDHQISRFTKERDGLIHQLAAAAPGAVLELQARIAADAPTLTDLLRQRSDLVLAASERSSIGLLDPATASSDPVGPKVGQLVALAGLAALILALGLVAILEALHPRVRGRRWVAAELHAPLLGHLPTLDLGGPRGARALREFGGAAAVLAARFTGRPLLLLPVERKHDRWAARVCAELEALTGLHVDHAPDATVARPAEDVGRPADPVVIVLSPTVEAQRRLEELARTAAVMDWPVVGVLTFRRRWLIDRQTLAEGGRVHRPPITPLTEVTPEIPVDPADGVPEPRRVDHGALSSHKMWRMP
ncbi:hypothetical protein ASE25_03000 [Terrabacter sp. Root85]|uniref:hypothetical protein n=1 Tax=Terrabacter sp. Root85 TaxID=1736603 RepID=UPI0006FF9ADE|nr:hypothetical protein [Terrabacter sp. Root85]KRC92335.1 hypothetical protein ASE25_03000 [Terrabacter sp. Root85]